MYYYHGIRPLKTSVKDGLLGLYSVMVMYVVCLRKTRPFTTKPQERKLRKYEAPLTLKASQDPVLVLTLNPKPETLNRFRC